jgi:heptose I phosphotransferase
VSYGSLWQRWFSGVSWIGINEHYRARLPDDLTASVMTLESRDRFHAKQGRSTARVVLVRVDRPLAVYLKRHFRLPWPARLAALVDPGGKHSPAAAEWAHLEHARALGIDVPEVVAAGEHIGPRAHLQSFVMIAELSGSEAVNELLPRLATQLDSRAFETLKRRVIAEMARITATLHAARAFHKDLYLCHFFLDHEALNGLANDSEGETSDERSSANPSEQRTPLHIGRSPAPLGAPESVARDRSREERVIRLSLIDLHRLKEHKLWPDWWRWKDLGQLLFSTYGVAGITDRDRLRFWSIYRRRIRIRRPRWHVRMVRLRAARYLKHNRKPR